MHLTNCLIISESNVIKKYILLNIKKKNYVNEVLIQHKISVVLDLDKVNFYRQPGIFKNFPRMQARHLIVCPTLML